MKMVSFHDIQIIYAMQQVSTSDTFILSLQQNNSSELLSFFESI